MEDTKLERGDTIRITLLDDRPCSYKVLRPFDTKFTGGAFLGCRCGAARRLIWRTARLRRRLEQVVHGGRRRCNIDCMVEQLMAEGALQ